MRALAAVAEYGRAMSQADYMRLLRQPDYAFGNTRSPACRRIDTDCLPMKRRLAIVVLLSFLAGCSALLPKSKENTASPWQTYQDAQETFDKIIPGQTTIAELRHMSLDPSSNANIAILNYTDVMRKFLFNQSFSLNDLDQGVRDCVTAKILCRGFEINQTSVQKHRNGNVMLDVLGFYRETHTAGWRFNGLILLKEDVVVYKLTGGQPAIRETAENQNPLGPVQAIGSKIYGITF